jgi:hypothetical protein
MGSCQPGCSGQTCGTGDTCSNGHCVPAPAPTTGACVYNTDCATGQTCINGFCHAGCGTNGDCTVIGDSCINNVCKPDTGRVAQCKNNAGCPAGQECVNAQCKTHCFTSNDCMMCSGGANACNMGYCEAQVQ